VDSCRLPSRFQRKACEATGNECNESKREALWAANNKVISVGLPKPTAVQNMAPYATFWMTDGEKQNLMFSLLGFSLVLGQSPIPSFWKGNVYSVPLYIGNM
jgi:hypothetical protein